MKIIIDVEKKEFILFFTFKQLAFYFVVIILITTILYLINYNLI